MVERSVHIGEVSGSNPLATTFLRMIETEAISPTNWKLQLIDARNQWSRWAGDELYWTSDCQQCPFHFEWRYTGDGKADTCEWGVVYKNLTYPLFETRKKLSACAKKGNESPRVNKVRLCKDKGIVENGGQSKQPIFPEFMEVTESGGDIFTLLLKTEIDP